jgi:DNA gyrase subunit A
VVAVRDFPEDRYLMIATRHGQVKKTSLDAYGNVRKGGLIATGLNDDDWVIGVAVTNGDNEIILGTADGKAIRFKEEDVRPMGRTAAGVRGVKLTDGDEVVDMIIHDPMATLLTVCEKGYGKRTDFEEYRIQGRGGAGIINIKASKRNGKVVAMKAIRDGDELMMMTYQGQVVRTGVGGVRIIGRATQGVRLITLKPDDSLVSVARVVNEDDDQPELPLSSGDEGPAKSEDDS